MTIERLFPVQRQVIPLLLSQQSCTRLPPNDLCVTAPTGSGKTLAYVLPIISELSERVVPRPRALVLVPVGDLAEQVYGVFRAHIENQEWRRQLDPFEDKKEINCDLKVALLSSKNSFVKEQAMLQIGGGGGGSKKRDAKRVCAYDIIVATPGRLVDHVLKTSGFDLGALRYLVLDECDRIMDEIKQNWLQVLDNAVHGRLLHSERLNVNNLFERGGAAAPLQRLLFSATLAYDPEKLQQLRLFKPIFVSVGAEKLLIESSDEAKSQTLEAATLTIEKTQSPHKDFEVTTEATTIEQQQQQPQGQQQQLKTSQTPQVPSELVEQYVRVIGSQKPLIVIYMIKVLAYRRMLCFVNSRENAKRLSLMLELNGITSAEYSSLLRADRRKRVQTRFESGELDVLVCSDVMARGMDLHRVDYVLMYDPVTHARSYVHKIGRTARAGRAGTAITLLESSQIVCFKRMIKQLEKEKNDTKRKKIVELKISKHKLKPLLNDYRSSLETLKKKPTQSSSSPLSSTLPQDFSEKIS
jgi:ATP-dependent RNA helicase DDX51/DBP6